QRVAEQDARRGALTEHPQRVGGPGAPAAVLRQINPASARDNGTRRERTHEVGENGERNPPPDHADKYLRRVHRRAQRPGVAGSSARRAIIAVALGGSGRPLPRRVVVAELAVLNAGGWGT